MVVTWQHIHRTFKKYCHRFLFNCFIVVFFLLFSWQSWCLKPYSNKARGCRVFGSRRIKTQTEWVLDVWDPLRKPAAETYSGNTGMSSVCGSCHKCFRSYKYLIRELKWLWPIWRWRWWSHVGVVTDKLFFSYQLISLYMTRLQCVSETADLFC